MPSRGNWRKSKTVEKLYCAPGNAGIASVAECVPVKAEDLEGEPAISVWKIKWTWR